MTTVPRQRPFEPSPNPGLKFADFSQISENGFGDGHNSYAHSMAWFNNHLYAGTTRSNLCLIKLQTFADEWNLATWPVECPDDIEGLYQLDRRAQIWRYEPTGKNWQQVSFAPMVMGSEGKLVAREMGYRAMTVFQGASDPAPALYVATMAPGRAPGPVILRSLDGENFTAVSDYGILGLPITSTRLLVPFKDRLFTSPTSTRGGQPNISGIPIVYESRDPASGQWVAASIGGFGEVENEGVFTLCAFNDELYAGTLNSQGFQVWRSDCQGNPPYQWTKVIDQGAGRGALNQIALTMKVFNNALYVGTGIQNGGHDIANRIGPAAGELIRIFPDDRTEVVVGMTRDTPEGKKRPISGFQAGFGNFFNGYFWCMETHQDWLYLGTCNIISLMLSWCKFDQQKTGKLRRLVEEVGIDNIVKHQSGFELWRSRDGENWLPVDRQGFANPYNIGVRNLVSTDYGLFIGTTNPFGPRVAVKQNEEWVYTDNPKGGLEVWLGLK